MATKLGRMVTYLEWLTTIKLHNTLIAWSCKAMWQTKIIISLLPNCLWPQTCRMVAHLDGLLIIKSCKALIMWSCKVTWQTKTIISPLQESLGQANLAESWPHLMDSNPQCHITLWSHGLVGYNITYFRYDYTILRILRILDFTYFRFTYRRRFST